MGSRFPDTSLHPGSVQDPVQTNNSNPIFSCEVSSLTPSLTHPFTFVVTQQPDFTEILESELCFCQNDPQTSHSSIYQYCNLQSSALVSFPALNKPVEILELVITAWCWTQINFLLPKRINQPTANISLTAIYMQNCASLMSSTLSENILSETEME